MFISEVVSLLVHATVLRWTEPSLFDAITYIMSRSIRGKSLSLILCCLHFIYSFVSFNTSYFRYEKRHSNIPAHISPCFRVKEGDHVTIGQCRLGPTYFDFSIVIFQHLLLLYMIIFYGWQAFIQNCEVQCIEGDSSRFWWCWEKSFYRNVNLIVSILMFTSRNDVKAYLLLLNSSLHLYSFLRFKFWNFMLVVTSFSFLLRFEPIYVLFILWEVWCLNLL